jgi:hypothetical protein
MPFCHVGPGVHGFRAMHENDAHADVLVPVLLQVVKAGAWNNFQVCASVSFKRLGLLRCTCPMRRYVVPALRGFTMDPK